MTAARIAANLDPIRLQDLEEIAALQTRKDRKYLVPVSELAGIIEPIELRVLEIDGLRTFRYESVYFDTPDHTSYLAAAYRRRRRFKVRTRSYVDSGTSVLEVKTRERRGLTMKHRLPYEFTGRDALNDAALEFIAGFELIAPVRRYLRPSLTTRYRRITLLEPVSQSRVTIDADLECIAPDGSRVALHGVAIVETKTDGGPCQVDRLLWKNHHRPTKISKYGTGMAALEPSLPANKWNRALRRYFGWSPRPEGPRTGRHSSSPKPVCATGNEPSTATGGRAQQKASARLRRPRPLLEGAQQP